MARSRQELPATTLLNTEQVVECLHSAGLIDLNEKWVKNQADRGMLPYVVVARRRRFRKDLIEKVIRDWCTRAA